MDTLEQNEQIYNEINKEVVIEIMQIADKIISF